jgi:predicted DNA-binding ribbon-helix-helix protein
MKTDYSLLLQKYQELERENAALREQNENLASLLFRVLRKLDKNDPLRIHCLDYLKKIGRTLNPFRAALDAVSKEEQP